MILDILNILYYHHINTNEVNRVIILRDINDNILLQ